jgi:uncharacterized protein (DUF2141 family)
MGIKLRLAALLGCLVIALASVQAVPQAQGTVDQSGRVLSGCTLRIHVDGLRNSNGNIGTVIFSTPEGWPDNSSKAVRIGPSQIPAGQLRATAVWDNLPPGDYAVAAIHDENSNARLDKNFLGIPKEGFGFANNPRVTFGPASFKESQVHVTCPSTETTIHIQYK